MSIAAEDAGRRPEVGPTEFRVMSFNIWLGGEVVDLGAVVRAIEAADADVVGLQEAEGNAARIAGLLGWAHVDEQLHVVSRYPLSTPPEGDGAYAYVHLAPGQVVGIANIHLPSDPYGPYLLRDGATVADALRNEQDTRMPPLEPLLRRWRAALESGLPMVLTGDLNSPSHRDWTTAAVGVRPHVLDAVGWPVTEAIEGVGFVDTYRAAYPDPVDRPGITWTFGYPHPRLAPDEAQDRIDFVFAGGATVVDSRIVGPAGVADVDVAVDPFPSDHLAVVSTVVVDPVEPPPYVAPDRVRVERGDPFTVTYHAPGGEPSDRIAVVPSGGTPDEAVMWLPPQEASFFGRVRFGTGALAPGAYDVVLVSGDAERSRARVWVVDASTLPTVTVVDPTVPVDGTLEVRWDAAPGARFDWIGIWTAGEPDLYGGSLAFSYTGATVTGTTSFDVADLGLAPGEHTVRLLSDDGYAVLAETTFRVVG